jgi:hypothetical protein
MMLSTWGRLLRKWCGIGIEQIGHLEDAVGRQIRVAGENASVPMRRKQAWIEPRHDHAPNTDDVWAWIIIGLLAGSVALTGWLQIVATVRV